MTGGTQQSGPSEIGLETILVAARHTPCGVVWMEMPKLLGLSYQVILPSKRRRILLANCPQEAECVNSQVMPCNTVPSGWPVTKYLDPRNVRTPRSKYFEIFEPPLKYLDHVRVSVLRHTLWNAAVLAFGVCCRQLPFSEQ